MSTASLVAHKDSGATPAKANAATLAATPTTGHRRATPRSFVNSSVPSAVSHAPAARNSRALTQACATRWAAPPLTVPTPAASTTKPSWAAVEAANSCLSSRCANATIPMSTAVDTPTHAVSGPAQAVEASRGSTRNSRYPPIATIAAECSSALTGLGPFIAPESQKEKGSCAALPNAATTIPAAATCRHDPCAAGRSAKAIPVPPAKAAPAAT